MHHFSRLTGYAGVGPASEVGLRLASKVRLPELIGRLQTGYGCLFTFHRVAPSELWADLPNRDFHIDAGFLGTLIDYLARSGWAVVTLDEALDRMRSGRRERFVNFSIDDAYRDTLEVALPVFRDRNVPVTVFVTSGIPDRTMSLWQAGLETILMERDVVRLEDGSSAEVPTAAAKRALFERLCSAWESKSPQSLYESVCQLNGFSPEALHDRHGISWSMLELLGKDPHVELGGHTINHPHLSWLSADESRREIEGCRTRLRERLGAPIRHFAFPFGRRGDCGEREFEFTRQAGYATAATTRKGLVGDRDKTRLHSLPRNTLNGSHRTTAHVDVHLSGLSGVIARGLNAT